MRVVFDTNVVLDVLLAREPFFRAATRLFALAEQSRIEGLLCATTVTTIDYLVTHALSRRKAKEAVQALLNIFGIALVNRSVLERALRSPVNDFEDAVLVEAAMLANSQIIITRNTRDFLRAPLPAITPEEFLAQSENA